LGQCHNLQNLINFCNPSTFCSNGQLILFSCNGQIRFLILSGKNSNQTCLIYRRQFSYYKNAHCWRINPKTPVAV